MKILLTTAHPFLPELAGGMQMSGDTLARSLLSRGHDVSVFAGLLGAKNWHGYSSRLRMKLSPNKVVSDRAQDYRVWRSWFPWQQADYIARKLSPDIVVTMAGKPVKMAAAFQQAQVPVLVWLQNVEFDDHEGDFAALGKIPCVANSNFTAGIYRDAYGVTPDIIHPIVRSAKYLTPTTREFVTMINPHPKKGSAVALELARLCPDIPFLFVMTWTLDNEDETELTRQLSALKNVTLHPTTHDMRQIYGRTRILLAPSQWQEGYGRVATEAGFSGIPVLASTRGGLPEAVGEGGVLLDATAPATDWAAALRRMWDDRAFYDQLSQAAVAHAARPAIDPSHQVDQWEIALNKVAQAKVADARGVATARKVAG